MAYQAVGGADGPCEVSLSNLGKEMTMESRSQSICLSGCLRRTLPVLVAVVFAAAPARAENQPAEGGGSQMHGSMPGMQHSGPQADGSAAASAPSTSAYEASMKKMHDKQQHVGFSGDADRDFAAHMIPHHQAAVDMARVQLQYGQDPQLRELAQKIISEQQKEIGILEKWLDGQAAGSK
jgi:hypothetical protein